MLFRVAFRPFILQTRLIRHVMGLAVLVKYEWNTDQNKFRCFITSDATRVISRNYLQLHHFRLPATISYQAFFTVNSHRSSLLFLINDGCWQGACAEACCIAGPDAKMKYMQICYRMYTHDISCRWNITNECHAHGKAYTYHIYTYIYIYISYIW